MYICSDYSNRFGILLFGQIGKNGLDKMFSGMRLTLWARTRRGANPLRGGTNIHNFQNLSKTA